MSSERRPRCNIHNPRGADCTVYVDGEQDRSRFMAYKTILVHLNNERRAGPLIDVAASIAARNDAHLIGAFIVPGETSATVSAYGGGFTASERQVFRDEAGRIAEQFEAATKGLAIATEWRMVDQPVGDLDCCRTVLDHSRSADLIIAGQTDENWDFHRVLDFPDRLVLESGRPALIVPYAGRYPNVGRSVMVAWNGRREAARAVFDALPILRAADSVRILWVDQQDAVIDPNSIPAAEIAAALARHGVRCEAARTTTGGIDVGNVLLSRLADYGTDLLVMGCYGHTRLREFILGGASRTIFRQMTVPVLMSH